jgi:hypothetical protein
MGCCQKVLIVIKDNKKCYRKRSFLKLEHLFVGLMCDKYSCFQSDDPCVEAKAKCS